MIKIDPKQALSAMMDSVDLINKILASKSNSADDMETLDRNYRHLEIMLAKDEISNACDDLSCFEDAIAKGRLHTNTPKGEYQLK